MSQKSIETITDLHSSPTWINSYSLAEIKFNEHCLINKLSDSGRVINLFISYAIDPWSRRFKHRFYIR